MRLISDFKDYYDELLTQANENENIYTRNLKDAEGKFSELKFLRSLGFETIALKPVSKVSSDVKKIVVYTDPNKHLGEGKQVMRLTDAQEMYYNSVCSEYIEGNEYTLKILQIGFKRFRVVIRNDGLKEAVIEDLDSLCEELYNGIELPMYSIDYIKQGDKLLACDFNRVQKLEHIGMDRYLPPALIVNEMHKYMNKLGKG